MAHIRSTNRDLVFDIVNHTLLLMFVLIIVFPLINIVSRSFSSTEAVISGRVWLVPVEPTFYAYETVFKNQQVWIGYGNSIFYTFVGTGINLLLTITAAYALSRRDFFGRNAVMGIFVFTLLFNGGLIPTYLLVKDLGMLDTRWALLLPNAVVVYNMIVARTFFQNQIPYELLEASQLDGCSDFRFFWSIVLPLSGPIVAVIALWYAVQHWNSYFHALLFIRNERLFPLQIVLRNILLENRVENLDRVALEDYAKREGLAQLLKYALIVVASVPVLLLYPFVQKYFVRGVMIGSLKG
jgi:multiple sugar transport system permease protein/putative aldouronate transport system permease protein